MISRHTKKLRSLIAFGLAIGAASPAYAQCSGVTIAAAFASDYTCTDLGTPTGVAANLGGVTFLDNDTLLIGGGANGSGGYISAIDVVRGADNHITGFGGASSTYATAPFIDGGLAFGPNGVLFATGYPNNTLLQYLPGATTPSKTISLSGVGSSVGTLQFVPTGFAGAGGLKIVSYSTGQFYDAVLTPDGSGTFDLTTSLVAQLSGGPEGLVYVDGGSTGFGGLDTMLVSEYSRGAVGAYQIDASGNPIVGSRVDFITGLGGAEGAVIDPLTGDFLFSTFGGSNRLVVISGGFVAPPTGVPEPASWALLILGFGAAGSAVRRTRARVSYAA